MNKKIELANRPKADSEKINANPEIRKKTLEQFKENLVKEDSKGKKVNLRL